MNQIDQMNQMPCHGQQVESILLTQTACGLVSKLMGFPRDAPSMFGVL
jgi:hypothetical protein